MKKKKSLNSMNNFKRGQDPKDILKLGVFHGIKYIKLEFLGYQRSELWDLPEPTWQTEAKEPISVTEREFSDFYYNKKFDMNKLDCVISRTKKDLSSYHLGKTIISFGDENHQMFDDERQKQILDAIKKQRNDRDELQEERRSKRRARRRKRV